MNTSMTQRRQAISSVAQRQKEAIWKHSLALCKTSLIVDDALHNTLCDKISIF